MSRRKKPVDPDEALGNLIDLVELRHALIRHCRNVRAVADLLLKDKTAGAVARLDGAITELEDVIHQQVRNQKIRLRAAQKRKRRP